MGLVSIRASSLSDLLDCPARWEARHIKNMRKPSGPGAILGRAVHASTALYDQSRMDGAGLTPDEAAGAVVDTIHRPEEDVDWALEGDITPHLAEQIGLDLHSRYCSEVAPTQKYLGVEIVCEDLEITDLGLILTGTTDRVRKDILGRIGIADLKTGGKAVSASGMVNTKGHGVQIAVYEILASHAIGEALTAPAQIVGLQTAKTPKGRRVAIGEIQSAMLALVGSEDSPGILEHASKIIHSGLFFGNPRSYLCSEKYCPAWAICNYRS